MHPVERRVSALIAELMLDEPVLLLEGPRSVGKSTLLRHIAEATGASVFDLDDLATRDAVAADPALFVSGAPPICIDEYQKVPLVLDAIKAELNRSTTPGRFVIAGSTRYETLPQAAQSLTGRLSRVAVRPFTQAEIDGVTNNFLDLLHRDARSLISTERSTTPRDEYIRRIIRGGFPLAIERETARARARWFDDYLRLTLERDARELAKLRQAAALPKLLTLLAARTAQLLNLAEIGESIDLAPATVESYTRILEAVFLTQRLEAWGTTLTARSGNKPKLHIVDSGIAAHLLRLSEERLARRDPAALTEFGHLLETFVVGELARQASWTEDVAGVGHWRTYDGDEVDFIAERRNGTVVAIEVKASTRVSGGDFSALRRLRDRLGDTFTAGVTLYLGERSYTFEDRLHVMPVDKLWQSTE
ncbi:ATP-binding protein [Agromyces italicus]|uniref:ATP-binding protein n=1 Tax=Agromyces italicus TaxID=279572 RepID=UPI0003B6D825|nr:ATP-binding protein [Agromyces italicus]